MNRLHASTLLALGLGLFAVVAQGHEVVRVGHNGRASGSNVIAGIVSYARGRFHSL